MLQEWQFWSSYSKKPSRFGYHPIASNPASPLDVAEQASSNCIFEIGANLSNSLPNWKVKLDVGHGKNSYEATGQRWCHRLKKGSVSPLWDNCTRDKLGFVPPKLSHCCVPSMRLSLIFWEMEAMQDAAAH